MDEIIDGMDDKGILDLMQGSMGDLDLAFDALMNDTYKVMFTGDTKIDFTPHYTDRLAESLNEVLRTRNLTYFITDVMPDFQLSWHHLEWGDLVHRHNKLCVEAARDHGKSYYFSNAYPAWKLYSYSKPKRGIYSGRPSKSNSNRGYLFSFSLQQSVDLMEILKGTIESNDILKERLYPDGSKDGGSRARRCSARNVSP